MVWRRVPVFVLFFVTAACSGDEDETPAAPSVEAETEGPCAPLEELPEREDYGVWLPVRLEGTVCGNGEPYTFFVYYQEDSADLDVTMEPGGACWDYDSCTGNVVGRLGVRRLDPAADDHMTALPPPLGEDEDAIPWGLMFPHYGQSDADVATAGFNHVHLPYCTGDGFLGSFTTEYESDGESLQVHHHGRANMEVIADWLKEEFPRVGQFLAFGSSAGGLGATFNYSLLRDAVDPVCSGLINDSSPIFVGDGPQRDSRQAYVDNWKLEGLLDDLGARLGDDAGRLQEDVGELSSLLGSTFPDDRFLVTFFQRDLNNSQFAYVNVTDEMSEANLNELWAEDTALLTQHLDELDNWGYFVPYFRADNCSHTVTLLPLNELENAQYVAQGLAGTANGYLRTDFTLASGMDVDFRTVLDRVLDTDAELPAWAAEESAEAEFTAEELSFCLD